MREARPKKPAHQDVTEEEVTVTINGEQVEVEQDVKDMLKKSEDYS